MLVLMQVPKSAFTINQLHLVVLNSFLIVSGSGKTYTMQPLPLKACQDILRLMHHTYRYQGFQLYVSFFEIYGGKLFDLLNDRRFANVFLFVSCRYYAFSKIPSTLISCHIQETLHERGW